MRTACLLPCETTATSPSGNDDVDLVRHVPLSLSLCHAGQVVSLGVRSRSVARPDRHPNPCTGRGLLFPSDRHHHEDAPMTTISTSELQRPPRRPAAHRRRHPTARRLQRLATRRRGARRPHPGRRRVPGGMAATPSTTQEIERLLDAKRDHRRSRDRRVRRRAGRCRPSSRQRSGRAASTPSRRLDGGAAAWAADETLPLERLPRYEALVHIPWLREVLAAADPRRRPTRRSCSCTSTSACPRSTPRATSRARTTSTRTGSRIRPTGTAARPTAIEAALAALGITRDTTVVVYGRDTEGHANEKWPGRRAGQIAATTRRS